MNNKRTLPLALLVVSFFLPASSAQARDWYVSASRGHGKKGSIEKPAKDLGNIVSKLVAGDVVHIAEGVYLGKGKSGADDIAVPVSILGGYDETFKTRDPWGAHRTVLSGDVHSKNYKVLPRLRIGLSKYRGKEMPAILVDGLIIDQAGQNRYKTDKKLKIVRLADPKKGENPTPDRGALIVTVSKTGNFDKGAHWEITVQNCVVLNSAPTEGALTVSGYKGSKITIKNNLVINNTGTGIYAGTMYHGDKDFPSFDINHNTVLFSWKYDAFAQSFSGNSLKIDDDALVHASHNVFGFADRNGVQKGGKEPLGLSSNLIVGNVATDYWETSGDQKIRLADLEDEAEYLDDDSGDNVGTKIKVPLSAGFLKKYGARVLVDRNAVEADIKAEKSAANSLRSMLGLPLQAASIDVGGVVWLPKLELDDALKTGMKPYAGDHGCKKP